MTFAATPNGNPFAGLFTTDPASTPEQVARKRAMIAALMPRFGSAKSVGEGIGQLATGALIGKRNRDLNKAESAGQAEATDFFNRLMGRATTTASTSGPLSILGMGGSGGTWTPDAAPKPTDVAGATGTNFSYDIPTPDTGAGNGGLSFGTAAMTPQEMIIEGAKRRGLDPIDVATAISYETGGTFDPMQPGPTTQYGQHRGLIQFGEPQAAQYGADFTDPNAAMRSQLDPNSGAVWNYLDQTGVTPGMGLPDIYSAINAGAPGRMGASDANNGGAPGTVADKVAGMGDHRQVAANFMGGTWTPGEAQNPVTVSTQGAPSNAMGGGMPDLGELYQAMSNPWLNDQQRSVIASMIDQQQQAADPMRQLQMQKAQLELAQMQNGAANVPSSFAAMDMQAQAAGLQPGSPEYQQFMLNGGAGTGGEGPAAFQALHMQAIAAGFEPGSDEYKQFMATRGAGLVAEAKATGEAKSGAAGALPAAKATADLVSSQINDLLNDPYLPEMLGPINSRLPNLSADAARVQSRIDQLQGGAFLQARQLLKGGGAITDYEGQKAEAAFVRMNQAQSMEDFRAALMEFNQAVQQGVSKLQSQAGGQPAAPAAGSTDDDLLKKYGG